MASIGGLSSSTSNAVNGMNGLKGFGGLASGLDRDSLIESMTYGTTSKIDKQKQKKTLLEWEQNAIRNITDKMSSFADKFLNSLASPTNLFGSSLWGRSNFNVMGINSKFVKVAGSATTAESVAIAGVKQLAQKAMLSSEKMSSGTLETGAIAGGNVAVENLRGKSINISYGGQNYSVTLPDSDEYDYSDPAKAAESINKALKNVEISNGSNGATKLSDVIQVKEENGSLSFAAGDQFDGKGLEIKGGSALEYLGFEKNDEGKYDEEAMKITKEKSAAGTGPLNLTTDKSLAERLGGQSITLSYNGKSTTVKLPGADDLKGLADDKTVMEKVKSSMQEQLDKAYGTGRVTINLTENADNTYKLSMETTKPDGSADTTSSLSVTGASGGMLGSKGVLGMQKGESNRLNLDAKLIDGGAGFALGKGALNFQNVTNDAGETSKEAKLSINGKEITVTEKDTLRTLMDKINKETDVNVSYQSSTDTMVFTSKQDGASGSVTFDENAAKLFGAGTVRDGQDAVIAVRYGDSAEAIEITRGSNSFNLDGLEVSVTGKFGYDDKGNLDPDAAVTFEANVDADKIVTAMKDFVKDFNEIIELVNKEVSTKPDRNYQPLTEAQKKELSENEAKLYEEKARQGLLFNDNDIKGLANELAMVISLGDREALKEIGLSVSSSYSDNGKIEFDETKFRAALAADPEKVKNLFTKSQKTDDNGVITQSRGIAESLRGVMDKYAKTMGASKGLLIQRAGSTKSPLSLTTNALYREMKSIDDVISQLQTRLSAEQDRYIKQFSSLETLISQMNAQSSFLSGFGG